MTFVQRAFLLFFCSALSSSVALARSMPQVDRLVLRHYDSLAPRSVLPSVPDVSHTHGVAYLGVSQRFRLPAPTGFLDSIRIRLADFSGEIINVQVYRDKIATDPSGADVHMIDYSESGSLGFVNFDVSDREGENDFWLTIPLGHLLVPQDFHVLVLANQVQGDEFNSSFTMYIQPHPDQAASLSSRTNALVTSDFENFLPRALDGFFTVNGLPLGVDLYMDAFVEVSEASVEGPTAEELSISPNPIPAGSSLSIRSSLAVGYSITIRNMLGQIVRLVDTLDDETELSTTGLARGVYYVTLQTQQGQLTRKLMIE